MAEVAAEVAADAGQVAIVKASAYEVPSQLGPLGFVQLTAVRYSARETWEAGTDTDHSLETVRSDS